MLKRLISVDEAAAYLGIKKSTLYDWAWKGKISSVKMGRRLVFDLKDLDRHIELHKREAFATIQDALSDITPEKR